ncbi:MAG: hypothetical protein KAR20_24075 [Candidatus Heimdallarchaeota archaeon]|nr:hypothetical protein [Candidatus Heimdallarchaeota archaeon]
MNGADFIDEGYTISPVQESESDWAKSFFQKRFCDSDGRTKYFINIYLSKALPLAPFLEDEPTGKAQFRLRNGCTLNMTLFDFDDVETVEGFFEGAWHGMEAKYYE